MWKQARVELGLSPRRTAEGERRAVKAKQHARWAAERADKAATTKQQSSKARGALGRKAKKWAQEEG